MNMREPGLAAQTSGACSSRILLLCWYNCALSCNLPYAANQGGHVPLNAPTSLEVERARTAHDALSAMLAPPQVRRHA